MIPIALAFGVLRATDSKADLGLVLAFQFAGQLGFLLVGGILSDRFSRKQILVISSTISAVTSAMFALMFLLASFSTSAAMAVAFISGASTAIKSPAMRGIVPEIASREKLQAAASALSIGRTISAILGQAIAGLVITWTSPAILFVLDSLSFCVAAWMLIGLPLAKTPFNLNRPAFFSSLRAGFKVVRSTPWLLISIASAMVINFASLGSKQIIIPSIMQQTSMEAIWGLALAASSAGGAVAGLILYRLKLSRPFFATTAVGGANALLFLAVGFAVPAWLLIICGFFAGLGLTAGTIGFEASMQSLIPSASQSRVFAIEETLSFGSIPLSYLCVGSLTGLLGDHSTLLLAGTIVIVAAIGPMFAPSVQRARVD